MFVVDLSCLMLTLNERTGLAEHRDRAKRLMGHIWEHIRQTGDRTLLESHYYSMRLGIVGPDWQSTASAAAERE